MPWHLFTAPLFLELRAPRRELSGGCKDFMICNYQASWVTARHFFMVFILSSSRISSRRSGRRRGCLFLLFLLYD